MPMAKSEFTHSEDHNEDRISVPVDDVLDIDTLYIEEGLVIHALENDTCDFLGKYVLDENFLPRNREEYP
jgi:hypothetical protein